MIEFFPITGHFGAEVRGLDLSRGLDEEEQVALKRGLLDYKVLLFEGQDGITPQQQASVMRAFGDLSVHPFFPRAEGEPGVDLLETSGTRVREAWHTDLGFERTPNLISMLRAVKIPAYGRDTAFCDIEAVYADLSPTMQNLLEPLVGVRDWRHIFVVDPKKHGNATSPTTQEEYDRRDATIPAREEPLICVNADTGRKGINADPVFTTHIKGLTPAESVTILRHLFNQYQFPDYQLRIRWRPGTIAMWDNRTTLHSQIFDRDYPRVMHRAIARGVRLTTGQETMSVAAAA